MNRSMPWGIANGAVAGALWGVIFLVPAVLHGFTPLQLALGRYLAYGVISLVVLLPRIGRLTRQLATRDWISLLWLSLAGNLLYYALVAFAVQSAGGAATSLVVGLVPVVIALAAASAPGAVPLQRLAISLLLSVIGVCLIAWQALSSETMTTPWAARCLGLLCAAGALLSWSAYSIGNSRALARHPGLTPRLVVAHRPGHRASRAPVRPADVGVAGKRAYGRRLVGILGDMHRRCSSRLHPR